MNILTTRITQPDGQMARRAAELFDAMTIAFVAVIGLLTLAATV